MVPAGSAPVGDPAESTGGVVSGGAPPPTVAEVLHAVHTQAERR